MMTNEERATFKTIGIVGGLGPHSHVELERSLLRASSERLGRSMADQDYPAWLVSSIPGTPDRTLALLGRGPSPVPALLRSLQRLAGTTETPRADFAIIACNTAHAFIDELRAASPIPILDMVELTIREAARLTTRAKIGLLATDGTLVSGVYRRHAKRMNVKLDIRSLLDLEGGAALQERLVMTPIYGPQEGTARVGGGIKSGVLDERVGSALREGVSTLGRAGAKLVICGCTEIPLALGAGPIDGVQLLNPMTVVAARAIAIALGEEALPAM